MVAIPSSYKLWDWCIGDLQVSFVEIQCDFAGHGFLGVADESEKCIEFGVIPEAVVDHFSDDRRKLIAGASGPGPS